jgi:hypothetical protein
MVTTTATSPGSPAEGVVQVEAGRAGWYYVQIGRAGRVKRFNLRDSEARQLVSRLQQLLAVPR